MKTTRAAVILTTICALISSGCAQRNNDCGLEKFRCQNGECIAGELLCDGRPDCKDQTDETQSQCTRPEITCPEYAFRCNYGACIDGDATCNGVKDCVDNSDETLPRCTGQVQNVSSSSQECAVHKFKCDNGHCIDDIALCDGNPDCSDGSDETSTKCGLFDCPQLVFRCAYGACIDGDLKCNGIANCVDASDEDPVLCSGTTTTTTTTTTMRSDTPGWPVSPLPPQPQPPRPGSDTGHTPAWPTGPRQPCLVPAQPQNGHWKLHGSQCPSGEHCDVQQGYRLGPGAYLVYSCNRGYRARGSVDVFCGPGGKWSNIPVCIEIRCKPLSSASTEATCTYNEEWASCETAVLPRTTAKLTCRNSYQQDTTLLSRQRAQVRCNESGQWEPEPIRCVPVCGVPAYSTKPLIVNGTQANITEFPWHATLYRADTRDAVKEFICGATIVQENLLITAAHCVYDESRKAVNTAATYYVATGNIFQDYDSPLHDPRLVKKATVKNIYIICNYLGLEGNYAWDIAILEIEEAFVFSALLAPVCLDTSTYSDHAVLEVGNYGKVAGFGKTASGNFSAVLQSIRVPYVPLGQCKSSSAIYETEKYITIDKFCAGYSNGSSVCDGDSGGGLVFKTGGLWYLRGVVSASVGTIASGGTQSCDSDTYSLYTRISNHIGWIQDVILKLETYKSYPSCPASS